MREIEGGREGGNDGECLKQILRSRERKEGL